MTTLLLFALLHLSAVLGARGEDEWTPNTLRKWNQGEIGTNSNKPAEEIGVHLVFVKPETASAYALCFYYPERKMKWCFAEHEKFDHENEKRMNEIRNELKNKQVKLTIVDHSEREILRSKDSNRAYGVSYSIGGKSPQLIAKAIKNVVDRVGVIPHERMRFVVCNAGSVAASNYMTDLLKEMKNTELEIPEIVAYCTEVVTGKTLFVAMSTVTNFPEETSWYFEKSGIPFDEKLTKSLIMADIRTFSNSAEDKNKVQMLFALDNSGKVYRHPLIKMPDNNALQRYLDSNINKANAHDHLQTILDGILRRFYPSKRKRRSSSMCTWTVGDVEEEYVIKENTLKIQEEKVHVEVVNRHNPEETHLVSFPLEESFYMKQVKETAKETVSLRKMGGNEILARANKAMCMYGIAAGLIGAGKFFKENDTVRGAITLSQSLHGLGEMTEQNQQLARMSQKIFQKALHEAAGEFGMENVLTKASSSLERFGESTAGAALKSIPFVGLVFQGYFISEDSIAIQKSNRSDPNQEKYFGLKVTNLVLDVSITVLTIAEVAFPPAAVILAPIVIGLTIARMSLGDFYCDVVSELDKLPQGASDFDKMIAVMNGLEEGKNNFLTGGLFRETNALDKEEQENKELLRNLSNPDSYYKITANDGSTSTLNLMEGILSQYGGFVTVQMLNNGSVMIQVGGVDDGQGGSKTIEKTLNNPSIQNIVLGVGESSKFRYIEKAAHLWWVIPMQRKKVICGEIKLHSSLFGTYYGNDKNNQFFAMQAPAKHTSTTSSDPCAHGNLDLEFVIKNYHYTIHGHGGDDSFFMGPQKSVLSGGEGRDLYVFPSTGTNTEIDNFSEDMTKDHMIIKAPFSHIDCVRTHTDLLLLYGSQRNRIVIREWFAHSTADHYQHMTFETGDGVRFKIQDKGQRNGQFHSVCVPETLDRRKSTDPISLNLQTEYESVVTVIGSNFADRIVGNEKNNIFNGGPGADILEGGEGADTYEIFAAQGCDKINNSAKDQKMDLVVFHVPFSQIQANLTGDDLFVFDTENARSTCVLLTDWNTGKAFQHVAFLSSDHVTFEISWNHNMLSTTALMIDLSKDANGSSINLSDPHRHHLFVITVFDSAHDDSIIGNVLGNIFSCSGGEDHLIGADGSDKYVIKPSCKGASIYNFAEDQATDVLFLHYPFEKVRTKYEWPNLILKVDEADTTIYLQDWFRGKQFQHLLLQTIDGVISMLPSNLSDPDIITPFDINLSDEKCTDNKRTFDFSKDPFRKVERFRAKSSDCSYTVIGNAQDNYIDPGIGNAMKYQYLKGGDGSDTYVFGHGYGHVNEIDNESKDMKTDYIYFEVLYKYIIILLDPPHIVLSSKFNNDSVQVRLLNYQNGPEHQHLVIKSSDGFLFQPNLQSYPYKSVLRIDTSTSSKSCNISCGEGGEFLTVSQIYGATDFSNYITGSKSSTGIIGGNEDDYLHGNEGNEKIEGLAGDDIIIGDRGDDVLVGGSGNDDIIGGTGNDMIYGGWGADQIDGGVGVDTIFFSGDVTTSTGVRVDLKSGIGEWADAENDTYKDVEAVSGTNFNDVIIGNDEDNELVGKFGNDTLVPWHGSDYLFGGPGNDMYILDDCSGVKHINNFASDRAIDNIVIRDFGPEDACFFLQEGTLVISFNHHDPLLQLIQKDTFTIFLYNWSNNGSFHQHVEFTFANDTVENSSFFSTAVEIGPALLELNSSHHTLSLKVVDKTTVKVGINYVDGGISKRDTRLKYSVEVSDQLFFSDSHPWDNQPFITYSGLLAGVLYSFRLYVSMCDLPVLVLTEAKQRTPPNPPTNITVTHISHDSAEIEWVAPPTESDPNNNRYMYEVEVKSSQETHIIAINTSVTHAKISNLKPAAKYTVLISSVIGRVKSEHKEITVMETPSLCLDFNVPEGSTVIDERMTSSGPAVLIECNEGFQLTSSPEILCLDESHPQPCVPKSCVHQGNVISHGSTFTNYCFSFIFESRCHLGDFHPPIPVCCPSLPYISNSDVTFLKSYSQVTVTFSCLPGYPLSGPSRLSCDLETGEWSEPFPIRPVCSPTLCPDPPHVSNGRFTSPVKTENFKEGDVLVLECDDQYHPTHNDHITCRNGEWAQVSSCEPNAHLIDTYTQGYKLHGELLQWRSGAWTYSVDHSDVGRLSEFCCRNRKLELFETTFSSPIKVVCIKVKLETYGRKYSGKAMANINGDAWMDVCIKDHSAGRSYCKLLFQNQGWTVSVLRIDHSFHADYSYQCDNSGCDFQKASQSCNSHIQCRAMCDPYNIPNGRADCKSIFEGQTCSVSCNRLFNLKGSSEIWCTSHGWSSNPYCIACEAKLETYGRKYSGKAKANINGDDWMYVCIRDESAARSYCKLLFQNQGWTVSVLRIDHSFYADYSYQCDNSGCDFKKEPQSCNSHIQCRAMCNDYSILNGQTNCNSIFEGQTCFVSCNNLFNLQGSSQMTCTASHGWSSNPKCKDRLGCGSDYERGPHSMSCLKKLWMSVGCHLDADLSPTRRPDYWTDYSHWTVAQVREFMASLPSDGIVSYNPNCQVDECFPGHATVLTSEGDTKTMAELKLGDRVLAMAADGRLVFSEVLLWLDRRPSAVEHYVLLTTEDSSERLALSDDHVTFIATSNGTAPSASNIIPVFAKDLQRGHLLIRHDPGSGSLVARRVIDVQDSKDVGAYAPMTVEGNLIVDGHLVSCYALQCLQYFAHLPFAPYRLLHTLRSHVPFFARLFPLQHQEDEEGTHWYASAWHQVGKWFDYPFGKTCYPRELQQHQYL